jgi:hypothetical protein
VVCGSGQTNCGGKCVNVQTDGSNCGACGNVCGSGQTCTRGACLNNTSSAIGAGFKATGGHGIHAQNFLLAQPVTFSKNVTVTAFGTNVIAVSGVSAQLALYTNNSGKPGTLVVSSVRQSLVTGINTLKVSSSVAVKAGSYWLVHLFTGRVTLREGTVSNVKTYYQSATSFPRTFSSSLQYVDQQFADWVIGF